jgi:L-fucose isomerase-like protein
MPEKIRIGFVPANRGVFSLKLAENARRETLKSMSAAGLKAVVPGPDLTSKGMVGTFEDARKAAELFRRERVQGVIIGAVNFGSEVPAAVAAIEGAAGAPIFIFGCAEEGALDYGGERRDAFCGLLSIATALRQRLAQYTFPRTANCGPGDPALVEEFRNFADVCRIVGGVRGAVYGQIGTRPIDFETCAFDELALLRKFGIRTAPLPLSEAFEKARALTAADGIAGAVKRLKKTFNTDGMPEAPIERLARLLIVLERMIDENGMNGMALQCWSNIQEFYGVSPCSVMSYLNQARGVPVACEVDIHGTLSMHLLQLAASRPAALMDWNNRHFKEKDIFSAWHCGPFPPGECEGGCGIRVNQIMKKEFPPENTIGVLDGKFKTGPVTIARVTQGPDGEWKLLVVEGESVGAAGSPPGTNAWIRVADLDKLYRALLREFPHHAAMVHGRVGRTLVTAAQFLGLRVVAPLPINGVDVG